MVFKCLNCGTRYTVDYRSCPACGGALCIDNSSKRSKIKILVWIGIVILAILGFLYAYGLYIETNYCRLSNDLYVKSVSIVHEYNEGSEYGFEITFSAFDKCAFDGWIHLYDEYKEHCGALQIYNKFEFGKHTCTFLISEDKRIDYVWTPYEYFSRIHYVSFSHSKKIYNSSSLMKVDNLIDSTRNTASYSAEEYVIDNAKLLTNNQLSELNSKAAQITEKYHIDVRLITVNSIGSADVEEYAEEMFDKYNMGYGDQKSCILLLISMEYRDYDIMAHGYGNQVFTDAMKDELAERFLPMLSNSRWYSGFSEYLEGCEEILELSQ